MAIGPLRIRISEEAKDAIIFWSAFAGVVGCVVSIFLLKIVSIDFEVFPRVWIIAPPIFLLTVTVICHRLYNSWLLILEFSDSWYKSVKVIYYVSLALLLILPFALGIVSADFNFKILVPVAFLALFLFALDRAFENDPPRYDDYIEWLL